MACKTAAMSQQRWQQEIADAAIGQVKMKPVQLGRRGKAPCDQMRPERGYTLAQGCAGQFEEIGDLAAVVSGEHKGGKDPERWRQSLERFSKARLLPLRLLNAVGPPIVVTLAAAPGAASGHAGAIAHHTTQPAGRFRIGKIQSAGLHGDDKCILHHVLGQRRTGMATGNGKQAG